jgi:hypothetical protein
MQDSRPCSSIQSKHISVPNFLVQDITALIHNLATANQKGQTKAKHVARLVLVVVVVVAVLTGVLHDFS